MAFYNIFSELFQFLFLCENNLKTKIEIEKRLNFFDKIMFSENFVTFQEEDRTTDPVKRLKIKQMSELILRHFMKRRDNDFSCHFGNCFNFGETEQYIEGIPVSLNIIERIDNCFFSKSGNLEKYGSFKIFKVPLNNPLDNNITKNKYIPIYKELKLLYEIQESTSDNIQSKIKDVIEKAKLIDSDEEKIKTGIPPFIRMSVENINGIFHLQSPQFFQSSLPFQSHQFFQHQTVNPFQQIIDRTGDSEENEEDLDDEGEEDLDFKYLLFAYVDKETMKEKHYEYICKINCSKFRLESCCNIDTLTLLQITPVDNIEDAIEALQKVVNSFKFFDSKLVSPEEFNQGILERELFPLHENLNCCICLNPTMGITRCGHRICFKCRYEQISKNGDKVKKNRCPVCRKKNELNKFLSECFHDEDDEEDS